MLQSGAIDPLSANLQPIVDIAFDNCGRLAVIIDDILDMEKIEAGKMSFQLHPIDACALVGEAIEANKSYGTKRGITFVYNDPGEPVPILGDRDRLMQVLSNLMSNAAKFSPLNSEIQLTIECENDSIRISVTDTGPGIAEADQHDIFEKFTQIDSSDTRQKGGTGLGLSIASAIIEQHGGTIGLSSKPGHGSTFYVMLPRPA